MDAIAPNALAAPGAYLSFACHCEEQSDAAIRFPAEMPDKSLLYGQIRSGFRIRTKYCFSFCAAAGRTDCHASSPQSPPCSLRAPLPAKGAPLRGPQHWLAMTSINLAGLRISGHKWNVLRFRWGRSLQPLKCLHLSLSHAKTGTRCGAAGSGGGFSHCPGQSHIRPPDWPPAVRPQWPPAAPSDR